MNHTRRTPLIGLLAFAALGCFIASNAWAQQQKTVQEEPTAPQEEKVQLTHSTVAYVEGNHLITRQDDGSLEALTIPDSFRFHHGADQLISVHELEPGMIISEEVVSTTRPMMLKTVEVHDGRVLRVVRNQVYIQYPDNKVNIVTVPDWATIVVNGQKLNPYHLQPGTRVNVTFVTEAPYVTVEQTTTASANYPPQPAQPAMTEEEPQPSQAESSQPTEMAEARPAPAQPAAEPGELPTTASPVPLIGLLGLLSLGASFGFRALRKLT